MKRLCLGLVSCIALASIASCGDEVATDPGAAAALAWIDQSAHPLAAVEPVAGRADLAPFTAIAGTARIIGLGEATHGSHEFFTMKDRVFRHLVEDAGVTAFAIEATMPEAFAIDTYVRTGTGNPAVLLSHLYFWTWNTQEVANLIAWLRQWNQQHPGKQVGFYGFDAQYPGVAIDSVTSYVARVMPGLSAAFAEDYACLEKYRNNTRGISQLKYSTAGTTVWGDCGRKMTAAYNLLEEHRDELAAASSVREQQLALRMARVVIQWANLSSAGSLGGQVRDEMMAENIAWLLDREGPNGRLVLWAHDYHISRYTKAMGWHLDRQFHADYLPVGFAFGSGGLNAVEGLGAGAFGLLKPFDAPAPVSGSYEVTLSEVTAPNYYFDLRQASGEARTWLETPHLLRNVGSVYFPATPDLHFGASQLTSLYDVLIFIRATTPSKLLPFQY